MVRTVLHTRLVSTSFPGANLSLSPSLCAPRPEVSFWYLGVWGCFSESLSPAVLPQQEHHVHVDVFFFLMLGSTWGHFHMFANMLLLLYSFVIGLQLHVTSAFTTHDGFYVC